jgi:CDP-diacylglycerol--glycerol-3-phosphate 3-phosphatidyltransferase
MFDGLAARKLNAQSKLGATIDAVADHVLVVCIFISVSPAVGVGTWALWLVLGILLFKVVIVVITLRKYGKAVMSHSYGHKLGATLCFLFPMFSLVIEANLAVAIISIFMCIVMIEELFIALILEQPMPDFKGFLFEKIPVAGEELE